MKINISRMIYTTSDANDFVTFAWGIENVDTRPNVSFLPPRTHAVAGFQGGTRGEIILCAPFFRKSLSNTGRKAILLHEIGHLKLGHAQDIKMPEYKQEIQAWEWAYQRSENLGPSSLRGTVKRMMNNFIKKKKSLKSLS